MCHQHSKDVTNTEILSPTVPINYIYYTCSLKSLIYRLKSLVGFRNWPKLRSTNETVPNESNSWSESSYRSKIEDPESESDLGEFGAAYFGLLAETF